MGKNDSSGIAVANDLDFPYLYAVKTVFLFMFLCVGVMISQAQQKLSFEYDGNDLYQFVGKELGSPAGGALIAHYNLKPDAPRTYWGNYNQGISMVIEKGVIAIITLVVASDESNQAFSGILPEGILPEMNMKACKKQLGEGAEIRDKEIIFIKGEVEMHIYFTKGKMESLVLEAK